MVVRRDERREAKKLAVFLGVGLSAIGAWLTYRGAELGHYVCFGVGGVSVFLAFLLPGVWLAFFRRWMRFAELISWVMTRVILSAFYYLMLTPVALAVRVFGQNPLDLAFKDGKKTYWVDKAPSESTIERYRKQY